MGGAAEIPVDVRIVAATNRDLAQMVKEKTFREDLFWRLNVLRIQLPAARAARRPPGAHRALSRALRQRAGAVAHRVQPRGHARAGQPRVARQRAAAPARHRERRAPRADQHHHPR
ncbi:MAG: sigma 54-interacting transcriptional regulator [Polyangiales bacterium]